jgi:integrase
MGSIRKRGKYYGGQFRILTPDGGTKSVSVRTGCTDPNEARRAVNDAEQTALKVASASRKHGQKYCDIMLQAIRDAAGSRLTENKAREYISQIVEVARGKPLRSYSVRSWFDEFYRQKQPNIAASTASAYRNAYDGFLEHLGSRADEGIELVEDADVRSWRDARKATGLADKRVNNLLKYLSGPFTKAAKTGMIPINPVAATESLLVRDSVERKPFTREEVTLLLEAAPDKEWKVAILFGVYCGLRLGDAVGRKWGDIDMQAGTVRLVPEKKKSKGKEVVLPLHRRLKAEIRRLGKPGKPDQPLTPNLAKTPVNSQIGLSNSFIGIMADAGVERGRSVEGSGRGRARHERSFHSTRHTVSTWLADAGVAEDLRMLITDHDSRAVASKYTHHSVKSLHAAVAKLPDV